MIKVTWKIICDLCGKEAGYTKATEQWFEEFFEIPEGWNIHFPVPEEHRSDHTNDICEVCPECQLNPQWENYKITVLSLKVP